MLLIQQSFFVNHWRDIVDSYFPLTNDIAFSKCLFCTVHNLNVYFIKNSDIWTRRCYNVDFEIHSPTITVSSSDIPGMFF